MTAHLVVVEPGSPEWDRLWIATGREPFAHPAYLRLGLKEGERAVGVCWADGGGEVLLPLVLRPMPDGLAGPTDGWSDAVSPYGYGGPFVSGAPDLDAFLRVLLDWMRGEKVLTGFVRASLGAPLPPTTRGETAGYDVAHLSDNVVVSLTRGPEEQWRHYEHKVRKNVNKARRHELRAALRDDFGPVEDFLAIYHGTMSRRAASGRYWFGREYFETIRDEMPGSYWVVDVLDPSDRVVSTELVLRSETRCYSFLGGTDADAFPMAPNDLLKHHVIEHASEAGLEGFVLGGGYEPGDGIFRYKRAFDTDGVVPFHGVRLTADRRLYDALAAERPEAAPGFFPVYRAP